MVIFSAGPPERRETAVRHQLERSSGVRVSRTFEIGWIARRTPSRAAPAVRSCFVCARSFVALGILVLAASWLRRPAPRGEVSAIWMMGQPEARLPASTATHRARRPEALEQTRETPVPWQVPAESRAPDCVGGGCTLLCGISGTCNFTCPDGGCTFSCDTSSHCYATCAGGDCNLACGTSATCSLGCSGGAEAVNCGGGKLVCDDPC
jgi:hypothetical protein